MITVLIGKSYSLFEAHHKKHISIKNVDELSFFQVTGSYRFWGYYGYGI